MITETEADLIRTLSAIKAEAKRPEPDMEKIVKMCLGGKSDLQDDYDCLFDRYIILLKQNIRDAKKQVRIAELKYRGYTGQDYMEGIDD